MLPTFYERKGNTTAGLCSDEIARLVRITPIAGFVPIYTVIPIGVITAVGCNLATDLKASYSVRFARFWRVHWKHADRTFAADYIASLDGVYVIDNGWLNYHYA